MYTRNYSRRPTSTRIVPPPDYSGTSIRQAEEPDMKLASSAPSAFTPPPYSELPEPDERRRPRVPLEPHERRKDFSPPMYRSEPMTDPRYSEPRTDRKNTFPFALPATLPKNISMNDDDILLLSLILLLLSGSDEEIRDSKFILLILGYLFLIGQSENGNP